MGLKWWVSGTKKTEKGVLRALHLYNVSTPQTIALSGYRCKFVIIVHIMVILESGKAWMVMAQLLLG